MRYAGVFTIGMVMTEALGITTVPFIPYPFTGGNIMENSATSKPLSWFRPVSFSLVNLDPSRLME